MSDWADLAQVYEEAQRAQDLAAQSERGQHHAAASAECCAVCGDAIAEARRAAVPGCQTCVDCQREIEDALRLPNQPQRGVRK